MSYPRQVEPAVLDRITKAIIVFSLICGFFVAWISALRISGLLNPFIYIPSASMVPALSPGDHVVVEKFTFLRRKPRRGDIVVFRSDGIAALQPPAIYTKRIIGEPGEHLRIRDGMLYINDQCVKITNSSGPIDFTLNDYMKQFVHYDDLTIPKGQYFIIGDNITNSLDSRSFGCLPAENIEGRICFCLWPPKHFGVVQ